MADYYIDTGGSGTAPYDTWAKAANTGTIMQTGIFDVAVAGDTIHGKGTITTNAPLDIDQHEGDTTSGFIKVIGYNDSEVNDGTRFIIDGNNIATNIIYNNSMNYWWFENIEVKNSNGGDGFTGAATANRYNVFLNCCANNCDVLGFDTYAYLYSTWIRCIAYSNTGDGFGPGYTAETFLFCRSRDNGQSGFDALYGAYCTYIGCISDHNGNDGFESVNFEGILFNCVADHNTDDGCTILSMDHLAHLIGCRITNHDGAGDIGVNANSQVLLHGWNYLQNNDGANIQNDTLAEEITYNGASTDVEDQADTECGYTDQDDPEDYNLTDSATSRRTAVTIPVS